MKTILKNVCLGASVLLLLAGCAKPQPRMRVLWPPPPDKPRLEWIVTFYSEDDFPKTDAEKAAESVLGKPELHFFSKPMGVASAGDGVVYVVDTDIRNVRVVDFNRRKNELLFKQPPFTAPVGLAMDSQKRLYISDSLGHQIMVFDTVQKKPVSVFGKDVLDRPTFMALNERLGRLYVSDVKANRIVVFDLNGKHLFDFGKPGGGEGEIFGPQGIAIDEKDRVFVAEQLNARVQVFDADGHYLYRFGERGDQPHQFEGPRGLAFDSQGHLYVAETRKAMLMAFTPDGKILTTIGGERTAHRLGFAMPNAVFVDPNDRIYITDGLNRRMTIWQYLTPAYLKDHPLEESTLKEIERKVRQLEQKKQP